MSLKLTVAHCWGAVRDVRGREGTGGGCGGVERKQRAKQRYFGMAFHSNFEPPSLSLRYCLPVACQFCALRFVSFAFLFLLLLLLLLLLLPLLLLLACLLFLSFIYPFFGFLCALFRDVEQ